MKKEIVFLLLCTLLKTPICFAQKTVSLEHTGMLVLERGQVQYFNILQFKPRLRVKETGLKIAPVNYMDDGTKEAAVTEIYDNEPRDTISMFDENQQCLFVRNIVPMSIRELMSRSAALEWEIPGDKAEVPTKVSLSAFNTHLFLQQESAYRKKETSGFGSYYAGKNDQQEQWRNDDAELFTYCIVDLGNNRHIILLFDRRNNTCGYIIPTITGWIAATDDYVFHHKSSRKDKAGWKAASTTLNEILSHTAIQDFYHIDSIAPLQYRLADNWGHDILPGRYQWININSFFIKAGKNMSTVLFNALLEPLKGADPIRAAYPYHQYQQVLTGNRLAMVDTKGQLQDKVNISIHYLLCGTVSSYSYTLGKDTTANEPADYTITATAGGHGEEHEYEKRSFLVSPYSDPLQLSFLDGSNQLTYDGNTSFVANIILPYNWLLVRKNNLYGICSFDWDKVSARRDSPRLDSVQVSGHRYRYTFLEAHTPLTIVLPPVYDSMVTDKSPYENPIRIYKNGQVGYYPITPDARYTYLGGRMNNFIRFTLPGGRQGWLDLVKETELLDE